MKGNKLANLISLMLTTTLASLGIGVSIWKVTSFVPQWLTGQAVFWLILLLLHTMFFSMALSYAFLFPLYSKAKAKKQENRLEDFKKPSKPK